MSSLLSRIRRLWQLSGINVDGFEYKTNRKQIINKVTDIFRPDIEERNENLEFYNRKQKKKMDAQFIPRVIVTPAEKIINEKA